MMPGHRRRYCRWSEAAFRIGPIGITAGARCGLAQFPITDNITNHGGPAKTACSRRLTPQREEPTLILVMPRLHYAARCGDYRFVAAALEGWAARKV